MKTILATTYAVNPYKGSEDGMGWNFVLQIARSNKVVAITRENNQEHIEKYQRENPSVLYKNITFLYFDLPYWMRFWKKGSRGALLYYYMWQRGVVNFVKSKNIAFDIVHNLNFHNDWTPSFLWKLNKPFVWGPVGHHPVIPSEYLKNYGVKYRIKNKATWLVKKAFWHFSPALKKTIKNADYVWCMNSQVNKNLQVPEGKYGVMPSVASADFGWNAKNGKKEFTCVTAGRLVPLKGYDLTIKAFANFVNALQPEEKKLCKLYIVGSGPEKGYYQQLVKQNGIQKQVVFVKWIERTELMNMMKEASAFIFPSHEGAGMVVPEALSFGVPVICVNNEGPGEFINTDCGFAASYDNYDNTVEDISSALHTLFKDEELQQHMRVNARKHFLNTFNWDVRGEQLNTIYSNL